MILKNSPMLIHKVDQLEGLNAIVWGVCCTTLLRTFYTTSTYL